ncbi:MAG: GTP cyclohydrolase I FolE [Candidatus ainarchaeum sp.]|nr:GTP cyclohydrolase I FolE [Candidatus ainarchaeum sp.]
MDEKQVVTSIRQILMAIGENKEREGLKDTPKRVAKMYKEIFRGYDLKQKPKIIIFSNGKDNVTYDQLITDRGNFCSFCEHHMLPFFGQYFFGYIPDKKIMGLSKVARIVDFYSAKFQIQERLVKEIADEIEKAVKPKGLGVFMIATHLCKQIRGVKKEGVMTTCDLRGCFRTNEKTRDEFLLFTRN